MLGLQALAKLCARRGPTLTSVPRVTAHPTDTASLGQSCPRPSGAGRANAASRCSALVRQRAVAVGARAPAPPQPPRRESGSVEARKSSRSSLCSPGPGGLVGFAAASQRKKLPLVTQILQFHQALGGCRIYSIPRGAEVPWRGAEHLASILQHFWSWAPYLLPPHQHPPETRAPCSQGQ